MFRVNSRSRIICAYRCIRTGNRIPVCKFICRIGPVKIVNITADGVEISGFNITIDGIYNAVYSTVAGFNIHDNKLWTLGTGTDAYGIFVNISLPGSSPITLNEMKVQNNIIRGRRGVNFDRNVQFYFYL